MTTWSQTSPDTSVWAGATTLLWLLTEEGENFLHEDGDLWLLEESKQNAWNIKNPNSSIWNDDSVDGASWTKKNIVNPGWNQITPN